MYKYGLTCVSIFTEIYTYRRFVLSEMSDMEFTVCGQQVLYIHECRYMLCVHTGMYKYGLTCDGIFSEIYTYRRFVLSAISDMKFTVCGP